MQFYTEVKMSLALSVLICVSVAHLCLGHQGEEIIIKKNVPLLGGWEKRDPHSAEIQEAAHYAEEHFNTKSKNRKLFKMVNITSAYSQVTNVINNRIKLLLRKTTCSKSENHDLKSCELSKRHLECTFMVSYNPRNSKHEVHEASCHKMNKNTEAVV